MGVYDRLIDEREIPRFLATYEPQIERETKPWFFVQLRGLKLRSTLVYVIPLSADHGLRFLVMVALVEKRRFVPSPWKQMSPFES
jgi:hypothetical protein